MEPLPVTRPFPNESALNNQQPVDLGQESSEFGLLELQGLVRISGKACDSASHKAPFQPG
jgi:hypothetical protein